MKPSNIFFATLLILSTLKALAAHNSNTTDKKSTSEVKRAGIEITTEQEQSVYFYSRSNQSINLLITDDKNERVLMQTKIANSGTNRFELPNVIDLKNQKYTFEIELSDGTTLIRVAGNTDHSISIN